MGERKKQRITGKELLIMVFPLVVMAAMYGVHIKLPTVYPQDYEATVYPAFLIISMAIYGVFVLGGCLLPRLKKGLLHLSWLLAALFLLIELLDVATLKTGYLELPFIPSPDKILETAVTQYDRLTESFLASMGLLFTGLFFRNRGRTYFRNSHGMEQNLQLLVYTCAENHRAYAICGLASHCRGAVSDKPCSRGISHCPQRLVPSDPEF